MIFGIKVVQKKTDEHYQRTQHIFINLTVQYIKKSALISNSAYSNYSTTIHKVFYTNSSFHVK